MANISLMMKADKQPWYKEPWPWFLIGLPLSAILAGVTTLVLAVRSNDGLVTDDYYKQGLGINKVLARQEMAEQMGLRAELRMDGGRFLVSLEGRSGMVLPESIRLSVSHPTRAGEDDSIVLERKGDLYVGAMVNAIEGHRNLIVEDMANTWRLSSSTMFPISSPVRILPGVAKNGN